MVKEGEKVLNIRIPAEIHKKIRVQAAIEEVSIKDMIIKEEKQS